MILTPWIVVRLCLLGLLTALVQVTFFAKIELFGASPDGAALVVMTLGLLGGSVTGAVSGFSIGLVIDCLLFQTLGAFAATYMCVGYVGGRYRESLGPAHPRRSRPAGRRADPARGARVRRDPDRHRGGRRRQRPPRG